MKIRLFFFLTTLFFLFVFTVFSYSVAKEHWQQIDFDTTVKLQDRIPRKFDKYFSYFSILGSAEVTLMITSILAGAFLLKKRWLSIFGWMMIIPASLAEVFGKLVLYHPGPPVLFHRSLIETQLPSFYVHTNFSYPSGHMTRTVFLLTVLTLLAVFSKTDLSFKVIIVLGLGFLFFMMTLTRVYLGEHWLSDVIGGIILGIAFGFFATVFILPRKRPS